ncbi:MAG TPA: MlaD family protein [Thermoanaerobaculia bacterium]|nr:MlaD family protein [Thermoanaerobaculia bacterium]
MPPRSREVKVGLVVLVAFVVLAIGVFLIGQKNNLFSRKNKYYILFSSANGVKQGSPVQLDGVDVGTVKKVVLPADPKLSQIQVWIDVDREYAERIRSGSPLPAGTGGPKAPSQARIKTLGLLGDKYIDLTSGAPEYPVIPSGGQIPAAQPTDVDALLASGEDVMDNVVEISASLSRILARMERGEGLLGELTTDSESGRRLKSSLIGTAESMQRIADKIETGEGPLPRLLNDRRMADRLASSLDRLESLLAQAQSGPGLLPGLLNDPTSKQKFDETLATLNQMAKDLQGFTANLETSDALLPRLVNDEEYGREITGKVNQIVDRLNEISLKLSRGNGTAAKLINDPQIYDAVNDVIIGINESRILRWLIRNRQKKGIEKRYEDTKKELEEQGITPPPLDRGPDTSEPPADAPAQSQPPAATGTAPAPQPPDAPPPAAEPPPPRGI